MDAAEHPEFPHAESDDRVRVTRLHQPFLRPRQLHRRVILYEVERTNRRRRL